MNKQVLIDRFAKSLQVGIGSLFVGSGVSSGSGAPNWLDALKQLAKEKLEVEIANNDSLPLVAQHIVNRDIGNRGVLIRELQNAFDKTMRLNPYHSAIRLMKIKTIW